MRTIMRMRSLAADDGPRPPQPCGGRDRARARDAPVEGAEGRLPILQRGARGRLELEHEVVVLEHAAEREVRRAQDHCAIGAAVPVEPAVKELVQHRDEAHAVDRPPPAMAEGVERAVGGV